MLIALKEFIRHGDLYNQVFSQYGPFYYELWGGCSPSSGYRSAMTPGGQ